MKQKKISSIVLAAALVLSLAACQSKESGDSSQPDAPAGVAVQIQEVNADTISTENKVSGRVVTDGQESVFVSAQAQCTALFVEVGDAVTAGQHPVLLQRGQHQLQLRPAGIPGPAGHFRQTDLAGGEKRQRPEGPV